MNTRQIQDLLHYLGYPLTPDGIWGPESEKALKEFQGDCVGIPSNGNPDDKETQKALKQAVYDDMLRPENRENAGATGDTESNGTFWADIPNFTPDEFKCKCGGRYCNGFPAEPKKAMVRLAQAARTHFNRPATVVSGLRCQRWNTIQGGVNNSQHMYGEACDIYISGVPQSTVLAWFQAQPGVRYAYPIVGSSNVHFDIPKGDR